jgi:hypothetical protein
MTLATAEDRRTERTRETREAARRLLASLTARHHLEAIALATDGGGLITGAGERHDSRWLAALACLGEVAHRHVRPEIAQRLRVQAIAIGPYTLHVAALCDGHYPGDEIEAGVRRLYEPACFAA